ncbi:MAG: protein kinase domain-containing protein [Bradymonadia bacterium]
MDSTDPDALRTYLEGRLPEGIVQELMEQLATHGVKTNSGLDERLESSESTSLGAPSGTTQDHAPTFDDRKQIARLPTLSRRIGSPLDIALPVSQGEAARDALLRPGTRVKHFEVNRLIGRGGMGEVYLARDMQLGRKVALKVIRPDFVKDTAALERFVQEARVTARFNHPHIITIYAVGDYQGLPYLALEYLEGHDLSARIKNDAPGLQEALRISLAIAEAVREAHQHGVLHRDLKPANVLIPLDGRVRVVDFGLALELDSPIDSATTTHSDAEARPIKRPRVAGTPAYMAPEQWRGEACEAATDVWAIGLILHELVSGERPYAETSNLRIGMQVLSEEPVPMNPAIEGLPVSVAEIIRRCLKKDIDARPSIAALSDVLRQALDEGRRGTDLEESPFRGLLPFTERHTSVFFGRERELNACIERLRYESFLMVVGASGSGKTSLVQAGVIPRLRENEEWRVLRLRPGGSPLTRLAGRILNAHHEETGSQSINDTLQDESLLDRSELTDVDSQQIEIENLTERLRESPKTLGLRLSNLARQTQKRVLLVVDQLEELFTLCQDPGERADFIEAISHGADEPAEPVRVICTVRDDFLGHLARAGEGSRRLLEHITLLEAPTKGALKDILTLPLLRVGYRFDDDRLADDMIESVDNAASLPLLQFVARSLWETRDQEQQTLRRADYDAMGGVEGALAKHADEVLQGLAEDQFQLARSILLRLVTPEGTRRVCSEGQVLEGLPLGADVVYERLTKSRLLSVRRVGGTTASTARLELAHESLIHTWTQLARWIDESREELIILNEVNQAAELWERRGRRVEELWVGASLEEARRILGRGQNELTALSTAFLAAGEQVHANRKRRRQFWSVVIPIALLIVATVFGLQKLAAEDAQERSERGRDQAIHQRRSAERQRIEAQRKRVDAIRESAQAATERGSFLEARAKLREGVELADDETYGGFLGLWWRLKDVAERWRLSTGQFHYHATFSPDGQQLAVSSINGTVELIDVRTAKRRILRGHTDQTLRAAFHPQGMYLASAGLGPSVRIWDVKTASELGVLDAPPGIVRTIKYTDDGAHLIACGGRDSVRIWNTQTLKSTDHKLPKGMELFDIAGSVGEGLTIIGRHAGQLALTTLAAPSRVKHFGAASHPLDIIRFSRDGRFAVHRQQDDTIVVWRVDTIKPVQRFQAHPGRSHGFSIDDEGRRFALRQPDGRIHSYDLRAKRYLGSIDAPPGTLSYLTFTAKGEQLADVGDRYIRITNAPKDAQVRSSAPSSVPVYGLAVSHSGQHIAVARENRQLELWDGRSGQMTTALKDSLGGKTDALDFSPDDQFVAWLSESGEAHIWNMSQGREAARIPGIEGEPMGLRYTARGQRLIATTSKGLWVLEPQTGKIRLSKRWASSRQVSLAVLGDNPTAVIGVGTADSNTGAVELWDLQRGRLSKTIDTTESMVGGVAADPYGRWVASGTFAGQFSLWRLDGSAEPEHQQMKTRINAIAAHPSGDRVALAGADGTVTIRWIDEARAHSIPAHSKEVNRVSFSQDGKRLVSAGDDGTVRVWQADTGRPIWRTTAILTTPPRILNHNGWQRLRPNRQHTPLKVTDALSHRLELASLMSDTSPDGLTVCLVTRSGHIERWTHNATHPVFSHPAPTPIAIVADTRGCLVLTQDGKLHSQRGAEEPMKLDGFDDVVSLSAITGGLVVTQPTKISLLDDNYEVIRSVPSSRGVATATVTPNHQRMIAGYTDGSLEIFDGARSIDDTQVYSIAQATAAVSRLIALNDKIILVGYADGLVTLWDLSTETVIGQAHLHGGIRRATAFGNTVIVASDLGASTVFDISALTYSRCELTRAVWSDVNVVWRRGQGAAEQPRLNHDCRAPMEPSQTF